jgi:RHS repeat-associated protein
MPTNVRTDNKDLVTQHARGTVLQPVDPVLLKPGGSPGVATHTNSSATIRNAAGTVFDHGTRVAHRGSYLGDGRHTPDVLAGQNVPVRDGDNGFLSWAKDVFIEGQNAVMHHVQTGVNSLWALLPPEVKNILQNGETVVSGLTADHFVDAAKEEAQAMLDALMSKDTLIALAQTAVLMGLAAIPVVGQIAAGAATALRIKAAIEAAGGAAEQLKAILEQWSKPMSPAQLEASRKRLASFLLNVGVSALLAALGKAVPKIRRRTQGRHNSQERVEVGTAPVARWTPCPCSVGSPVIVATGEKVLSETDFELPGDLTLVWSRHYRSGDVRDGWFGQGWSHPLGLELHLGPEQLRYHDDTGYRVEVPCLPVGGEHFDAFVQLTFRRPDTDTWHVTAKNEMTWIFRRAREDLWRLPLSAIEDRNGRRVTLHYPPPPDDPFAVARPDGDHRLGGPRLLAPGLGRARAPDSPSRWRRGGGLLAGPRRPEAGPLTLARYGYSPEGDLATTTDAAGVQRSYTWRDHVLVGYTRGDGSRYRAEYDLYAPAGRVTRSWNEGTGEGLRFDHDDRRRAVRVTDALGRTTTFEYDERRDVVATVLPGGQRVLTPTDANGHPRRTVDPLGRETHYRFDERGNLTKVIDAAGAVTTLDYDDRDRPVRRTDALGNTWTSEYDERGNLTAETDPMGHVTRYRYDERGRMTDVTDALGGEVRLDWDEAGCLTGFTDTLRRHTSYSYDLLGRLTAWTDAGGHVAAYEWDGAGNLIREQEPDGATHRYAWDGERRLLAHVDAAGQTTAYRYDAAGRPLERTDAAGRKLRYEHDLGGRLIALVNENGAAMRFAYDANDNLVEETGFDGRLQRHVYDAAGHLTESIEASTGRTLRFVRDAVGRLTERSCDGDETCLATYTYDRLGRLTEAENAFAKVTFAYDARDLLTAETQALSGEEARTLAHRYDALGRRTATTLPDGRSLHHALSATGHLQRLLLEEGSRPRTIVDIERDALDREVRRTQGPLESRYEHDPMGRLVRHRTAARPAYGGASDAAASIERAYRYDAGGSLLERTDSLRGTARYTYDPTDRILSAHTPQGGRAEMFRFDPAGNLLDVAAEQVEGGRLEAFQDLRYVHDAMGNVVERARGAGEKVDLVWSATQELREATVRRSGVTQVTRYEYDALGRRTRKRDTFGATAYLWDGDRMIMTSRRKRESLFLFDADGFVPIATLQNGKIYWYQCDHIGAPLELTDEDGRIAWAADYTVWGETALRKTGTGGGAGSSGSGRAQEGRSVPPVEQPFRFQGQQLDEETGLHYSRFRYYDPAIGRFLSQDPIGLRGGINPYSYAPNPSSWIDPLGLARKSRARQFKTFEGKKPAYDNPGSHDKTKPGQFRGGGKMTSVLPCHHEALFAAAIPDEMGRNYFAIDDKGIIHRFAAANGKAHWSGDESQGDGLARIPSNIQKELRAIHKSGKGVSSKC